MQDEVLDIGSQARTDAAVTDPPGGGAAPISAAAGHVGAEELFRSHARFVAGFLARLGVPSSEVEDLVQEVFLTAHRRGGYVPGPARPSTWVAEIAFRVVLANRRSRRRRRVEPDESKIEAAADQCATPFEAAAASEARARVQRALDAIELERRAVFVLFELEGESCSAIASCLGVPVGTIYSRLHVARQEFQEAYMRDERRTARRTAEGGSE